MTMIGVSRWMFLLVPAYPGCPGHSPESCKMVVVVVVVFSSGCMAKYFCVHPVSLNLSTE